MQNPSTPVAKLDPKLDQKAVHDEYVNGNFEIVIERITAFQKEIREGEAGSPGKVGRQRAPEMVVA
jgi:hypothetical protein